MDGLNNRKELDKLIPSGFENGDASGDLADYLYESLSENIVNSGVAQLLLIEEYISNRIGPLTLPKQNVGLDSLVDSLESRGGDLLKNEDGLSKGNSGYLVNGRFEIKEQLGRGASGVAYKAIDTLIFEEVVLKFIPVTNFEVTKDAISELKKMQELRHTNVQAGYWIFKEDVGNVGCLVIVSRLVHGKNLKKWVKENSKGLNVFNYQEYYKNAAIIYSGLLEAVRYLHSEKKLAHRDIKPGNIIVEEITETEFRAVLIDFSLSAAVESNEYKGMHYQGTPGYSPIEQILGNDYEGSKLRKSIDIFALGIIGFQLFALKKHPIQSVLELCHFILVRYKTVGEFENENYNLKRRILSRLTKVENILVDNEVIKDRNDIVELIILKKLDILLGHLNFTDSDVRPALPYELYLMLIKMVDARPLDRPKIEDVIDEFAKVKLELPEFTDKRKAIYELEKYGIFPVLVDAGDYFIGLIDGVLRIKNDRKFWISNIPITVECYNNFTSGNIDGIKANGKKYMPKTELTKEEAENFASKLGGTLPDEIEWEMAARGKNNYSDKPWNDDYLESLSSEERLTYVRSNCWSDGVGSVNATSKIANRVKDMLGNVWEWCSNNYIENLNEILGGVPNEIPNDMPREVLSDIFKKCSAVKTVSLEEMQRLLLRIPSGDYVVRGGAYYLTHRSINYSIKMRVGRTDRKHLDKIGFRVLWTEI